ncbi:hypothetical protein SDRG_16184 [Saprolegnia diclina VS20]|uniref:Uncharacterized protein n=1 Tax=Saprolegnia diclina (strain VS20) TaxID=1156394 RepID=T0PUT8_SAPDV|nr:hypothetical protein SDRG_16184 [Saprolegnia diclina VS20]EQC25966.1 hypothetical protein SDRG_16184 [Saprolegnia diclina VS20]|eukprot:XP_008620605.1 hypothetical protein SDRG_16184 [Saprolegnia diclina VS20]
MATLHNDESEHISLATISAFLAPTTDFGDSTSSSSASSPPTSPSSTTMTYLRPKQEIEVLRVLHTKLSRRLRKLQARLAMVPAVALPWQARAIEQATGVQRARQESTRLQEMVAERAQVIEALQRVLIKHPKSARRDVSWSQAILGPSNRALHLEQLLRNQYEKRCSAWVRYGLYDARDQYLQESRGFVERSSNETLSLVCLLSKKVPLSVHDMSALLWQLKSRPLEGDCTVLEELHADLLYFRETLHLPAPNLPRIEARTALRRYTESNDSVVFAWRSIVDDHLYPIDARHVIGQRDGWATVQALDDGSSTFLQVCVRLSLPTSALSTTSTLAPEALATLVLSLMETNCTCLFNQLDRIVHSCQTNHYEL